MNKQILKHSITNAILAGKLEIKIYGYPVSLPSPQRTGTETQKRAYAESRANEIISNI